METRDMKIDILLPTRGRATRLKNEFLPSIKNTATDINNVVIYFYVDEDDYSTIFEIESIKNEFNTLNLNFYVGPRMVLSEYWNHLWRISDSEIILQSGDDVRFETNGWDKIIIDTFESHEDQIIFAYGNDGINARTFGTHGFVSRKSTEILGYFVPPWFPADYSDTWLNALYDKKGDGMFDGPERGINRKVDLYDEIITRHYHWTIVGKDSTSIELRKRSKSSKVLYNSEAMLSRRMDDIEKLRKYIERS
jgi:hypothetical protein